MKLSYTSTLLLVEICFLEILQIEKTFDFSLLINSGKHIFTQIFFIFYGSLFIPFSAPQAPVFYEISSKFKNTLVRTLHNLIQIYYPNIISIHKPT